MLISITVIILGLVLLIWSADKFVGGAASLAHNLGMSPLLIGLTIVSLGTSAPEILVSITAALSGASGIAIGNAIGSNIANIGLVLGITALVSPLLVHGTLSRKELPLLTIATLGSGALLIDLSLGMLDGCLLLAGLLITLYLLVHYHPGDTHEDDETTADILSEEEKIADLATGPALFWLVTGLITLIISSRALVWAATNIAQLWGVSDLVIGLTIVAIGTSLPELAASVTSALKAHHDMAIGNIVGSNIFNLLAVMAIPGVIHPFHFDLQLLIRDYGVMTLLTLLLVLLCYLSLWRHAEIRIGRFAGALFCLFYIAYMATIYQQSVP